MAGRFARLFGTVLLMLASAGGPLAGAQPLWPRRPVVELAVTAAPWTPSLSVLRASLPAGTLGLGGWLARLDAVAWYLADSAWLFPVSYLEVGAGARWVWLERRRWLLESGLGTALGLQTLEGECSVPLVMDGLARYALGPRLALQGELELLLYGRGFAASGRLGARWRPLRCGLLLGAAAGGGWAAVWDLQPGGGAVQLGLSAGYTW